MSINHQRSPARSLATPTCHVGAQRRWKPCEGGLAKEGEKLGNPSDLELRQKTFDRMK
jgi:hypothetical protein